MSNQVYALALDNTLREIKNVCPDVTNIFVFEENAQTIAKDDETAQETINKTVDAFQAIKAKSETAGGLEAVTIQGSEGRVNIASINNFYLATVTSKEADEKFVNSLTRILIPTVVKLVDQIQPAPTRSNEPAITAELELVQESIKEPIQEPVEYAYQEETVEEVEHAEQPEEETPTVEETVAEELIESVKEVQAESVEENGLVLPEPPVTQVIVESLGRLQFKSDTVRVDNSVVEQWKDLYGDRIIQEVELDALNGKTIRCKFSPIKDSKYQGKGVIQIPDKIQATMETSKGKLVMVKPVVE